MIGFFALILVFLMTVNLANADDYKKILRLQIKAYQEELETYPNSPDLHFSLAEKYDALEKLLKQVPGPSIRTVQEVKDVNEAKELNSKAIEHLNVPLKAQHNTADVHRKLSRLYDRKIDGRNAVTHMKRAEELLSKGKYPRELAESRKQIQKFKIRYSGWPEILEPSFGLWSLKK